MNAHALLTSQGWLGSGHALDSRLTDYGAPTYKQKGKRGLAYESSGASTPTITSGNGLVNPLLISRRNGPDGRFGIGKKKHEPASGNEWWLKGFQSALNNIGKSENERTDTSGTSTPVLAGKHDGLYGYFVAGQMMQGTIEAYNKGKKRKSDVLEEDEGNALAVKPVKRLQTVEDLEKAIPYLEERDKTRRKKHERAQSTDVEQFAVIGQFFGATNGEKASQKEDGVSNLNEEIITETKEERRARRRRRKEEKEKGQLTLAQMVEEELAKLSSLNNSEADAAEDSNSDRARRKAERRKKRSKKTEPQ